MPAMGIIGNTLFYSRNGADIRDVIRHLEGELQKHVDGFDQRKFDNQDNEEAVRALTQKIAIAPLAIDEVNARKKADEIQISVRDVFGDTAVVPGLRVSKTFPFTGDPQLWEFGTGTWSSTMPQGQVRGCEIVIGMEVRQSDGDAAANHINSTVAAIKDYISQQKVHIDTFNATLPDRLLPLIKARRNRRDGAQSLLDKF
jgi:hypothetical protein